MNPLPPPDDTSPPPESPYPAQPPVRKSAAAFVALMAPTYVLLGGGAQHWNPLAGLLWSQVFVLLLPAIVAPLASNLRPGPALLLVRRPSRRELSLSLLIGLVAFFCAGAIMSVTSLAMPERWLDMYDVSKLFDRPPWVRAGLFAAAALLAPICEELAFRGWILTMLRTRHAAGLSILLSALIFGAMHADPVRFLAVFALGLLYAWLAWRSGSIWPAILAHMANNAMAICLEAAGVADSPREILGMSTATVALSSMLELMAGGILLGFSMNAFQKQREPPPVEEALVRRDPTVYSCLYDPSRLHWAPRLAIVMGLLSFLAMAIRATLHGS